ncbi:hypothetical protein [Methanobacterium paludis]|uniref:Class III signal peptide-containing protein n=1 Tax=Methanobacterium paludis (strain DSM 25820 / JCM 18151 / SWAN1) TaxID=868131 RepID=F6D3S6_METPW|nr:hypothetical protein [Methanobacterium paludis]AEG18070.1 hypothetical protein MSWAN_1049 [Methanobacterium paludis]
MDEKGFASAELIFVTLIVIVIVGGLVTSISNETNQNQTGNMGQARMTGENIAETVNTVYTNGPGYTIKLNIPSTPNLNVCVSNSTDSLTVLLLNNQNVSIGQVTINLIPTNIQTKNLTSGRSYNVTNNNGRIVFS